ncbi:F-box only 39 [Pelobates cultripes]|uniref:F-box only 39 n=1 Tax=Pelobates cultripes TaxID=61616 RepID=A0AAD1QXT6_PELCU|nr:F-box only 39 [Pelobates cultripes]
MDNHSQSSWDSLPQLCLQKIFMYLGDKDRTSAASVCRKWNQILYSAILWKSRTIIFGGRSTMPSVTEFKSAVRYVKKFGIYLENLEIRFLNVYNSVLTRDFQMSMKSLLANLGKKNKCLKCFSIPHLELERVIWSNKLRDTFIQSLSLFLKKMGKNLESLNIRGAKMSLEQGCTILKSLSSSENVIYLAELNIEDFFTRHIPVYSDVCFHEAMSAFHNLNSLTLNYSCISDTILEILCENCRYSLSTLTIKCHIYDPHMQVVAGKSWKKLAQEAKNLQVNFLFERVLLYSDLSRILLPEIPASNISIRSCYFSDRRWSLRSTVTELLPNYKDTLQKLTLEYSNHEYLDDELIKLVLLCKKLNYLKLWAFLKVAFVERILQKQKEGKCSLETFKIRIYISRSETVKQDKKLFEIFLKYMDIIPNMNYFAMVYPYI